MEFPIVIVSYIHVSVLKDLGAILALNSLMEISSIMLKLRNFESSITMTFALKPGSNKLGSIRLNLPTISFFESFSPFSLVNYISFFVEELDNPISMTLVLFELT